MLRPWHWFVVLGLLALALALAGLVVFSIPSFQRVEIAARHAAGRSNLRQLAAAVEAYAAQHDGRLPPAEGWVEALGMYVADLDAIVAAPGDPASGRVYAMNRALGGERLGAVRAPSSTVLFFEVEPGSPESGGPELLVVRPGELNACSVIFADGNTRSVLLTEVGGLVWGP